MNIYFIGNNKAEEINRFLLQNEADPSVKGSLMLTSDVNGIDLNVYNKLLLNSRKPVFGGLFPALIYQQKKVVTGTLIVGFDVDMNVNCIDNITGGSEHLDKMLSGMSGEYNFCKSILVFVDGLSLGVNLFIESLLMNLGLAYNYLGAGAGSGDFSHTECIFTNTGVKKNCAVIAGMRMNSGIGIKHGWSKIGGPFAVTRAENNTIYEIENKPALDVYNAVINTYSGSEIQLNHDNFFGIAKAFPFGIDKVDSEYIVRDPIMIGDDNSLVCVGHVGHENSINILHGVKNSLIKAAGEAVHTSLLNLFDAPEKFIFVVDCISRVLFLEDDFKNEIKAIHALTGKTPMFGVLSIGEIANNGNVYLEFYNKTCVVGSF